ncbi:acyl-CoA dehydratase activase-related protein [Mailhella sp.]|uniref:acyl-CoA dehydratase activase-related protein n=1 Tax=Mailhella sp. TaxID=1981029 RepID=UPI004063B419
MTTSSTLAHIGLDIGSTTVKLVILDPSSRVLYARYQRHLSDVRATVAQLFREALAEASLAGLRYTLAATGSGAIALTEEFRIPFVQEVIASAESIRTHIPDADVTIELGGEDAKITFFTGGVEQRMNETCAGGTGAFIDQMAAFLDTDAAGLNELASRSRTIYPIASRCGVFAKTDILPLLNEGCAREDIAASIFQAVVEQAVSGLACGRVIRGKVAFLGGPLAFLTSLRQRFVETLELTEENAVFPPYAEYFVAMGTALDSLHRHELPGVEQQVGERVWTAAELSALAEDMTSVEHAPHEESLPPLFEDAADLRDFRSRHASHTAPRVRLNELEGTPERPARLYLGIDAGSTTIKSVLADEKGRIAHSTYAPSQGRPLDAAVEILRDIYEILPENACIAGAGVTGYGGGLIRAGLHADVDEVETLAHCKAAQFFLPEVSFVLDIGGQDIKCLHVKDGIVDRIQLNEACSAGCGSFIETFAKSLGMTLPDFVNEALSARHPVDLGTRCTVFMNSRVKQAQKEGRSVGDIAAGLSYSVVKNALYKVIKISGPEELGEHVIAQGGSFKNDALLRALELSLGREVLRLDIAGLMGAFGAALIARENAPAEGSSLLSREELAAFRSDSTVTRCKGCSNHCLLTISRFSDGTRFISGNRCEKGAGHSGGRNDLPNLFDYKYKRLFQHYTPLPLDAAPRGVVGIPRVLNMYEDYPMWFTLFTHLGFRVELSSASSKTLYAHGMSTIPSQTVCYPAKLSHGHVMELIGKGVRRIFYPCIAFERQEFFTQHNRYNCPVVGGYPELLKNNVEKLREMGVDLICPFLPVELDALLNNLLMLDLFKDIPRWEVSEALAEAFREKKRFKEELKKKGEEVLDWLEKTGSMGIILAGHPYHVDPEVHHGIPDLVTASGLAVLSEDSVAHLMPDPGRLRVVDQWTYHARLYRAAAYAAQSDSVSLVQLVSFGCGLDAVTADQVEEILAAAGRLYTQIKIDEGANLGAARIRVRSLLATMRERRRHAEHKAALSLPTMEEVRASQLSSADRDWTPPPFTEEMRKTHTILIPQMSPLHFQFLPTMLRACGYKAELLESVAKEAVEEGLRHVNNDVCYPAITVIGQLLHALQSGKYDRGKVAVILSQTGGGCRATNYIGFLHKALRECGLDDIPVISFNLSDLNRNPGFRVNRAMLLRSVLALFCGDALMRMLYRTRPYEVEKGSADALAARWASLLNTDIHDGAVMSTYRHIRQAVQEFDELPLREGPRRPQVGLVGEILLKYHPDANNNAVKVVEAEGGEAVMPDFTDFILYGLYDEVYRWKHFSGSFRKAAFSAFLLRAMLVLRLPLRRALSRSRRFEPPVAFRKLREMVNGVVSLGQQTGEGWLLTAEMMELLHSRIRNILCMQPFGCLPNHITGKGVIKELKRRFPEANIAAVDYDPGASEVNQINRIKLMMAVARQERAGGQPSHT